MNLNSKIIYADVTFPLYLLFFLRKWYLFFTGIWHESNRSLMNKIILIYNFYNRLIYIIEYQFLHWKKLNIIIYTF